ncbi:MAG TPA: acetyl-CoA carboxylase biotin carboxylase subunit [Acidobacteriota bacterium]|nr:acetyl-CoA carboxylase biotin carboxylase subunit [Acidobacteriota bacterium]
MFNKVLIANRGEIAVRIMRTCREMGIHTVAVYSEVDVAAAHVLEADEAILLGESEPSKSYLNIDRIIAAAQGTGAEAIHPGYGFLAENPSFAERCEASGINFIGPPARVIRDLGNKTFARRIMETAGVPVIPGMFEATTDLAVLCREADQIGYPVLVKAVAGGGGKGMRIVSDPDEMQEACLSATSEAEKAFGDGSLYLEKRLDAPRHIEFQILADQHGNVVHLFERECSIQRRHQKIIEETPSPAMTASLRNAMGKAAVSAARASGYINAGTVEFLLDRSGQFYFLEVNTRLQVEHPVTEMTTGIDLVAAQLQIAAGSPLTLKQKEITQRGHAIECRIYAEDPEASFYPSPGLVLLHREPSGPGVRNDCGIYEGFEVPVEYDPILSKLIVTASTREAARRRMIRALESYAILGIRTTIPFLIDVLGSPEFAEGNTHTDFIDRYFENWTQNMEYADLARIAYVLDEFATTRKTSGKSESKGWPTPWETLGNWRL